MSVTLITIANHKPSQDYYCHDDMMASVRRHGVEPVVISEGYGGLGSKPRLLKQAIASGKVSTEFMIFIDAFDVILIRSPQAIVDKFLTMETEIAWNAEKNCFPIREIACDYPPSDSPWRFLNSGFCVARTESMLKLLNHINADAIPDDHKNPDGSDNNPNDQAFFSLAFVEQPQSVPMRLDTDCALCQNMVDTKMDEEIQLSGGGIHNRITSSDPMAVHWAGGSKTDGSMEPILKHLKLR